MPDPLDLNPLDLNPADFLLWERIGWVRVLVGAFRERYDAGADDDPGATAEMLRECEALADELERGLGCRAVPGPKLSTYGNDQYGPDVLFDGNGKPFTVQAGMAVPIPGPCGCVVDETPTVELPVEVLYRTEPEPMPKSGS